MSDRLLTSIIELEQALHEEVRREQERAAAWQERELAALGLADEDSLRQLQDEAAQRAVAAQQAVEAEAARWQAAADSWCARLAALPDAFLESLLQRHLSQVLPEADDDHSHGQG